MACADGSQIHGDLGYRRAVAIEDLDTDVTLAAERGSRQQRSGQGGCRQ
jgi:hypothetical protein